MTALPPTGSSLPYAELRRRTGGRPSRDQAERLRERILDVATELLLTHGYGATSIEAVAREAGVSKRTFYHRFADKPALINAVVERLIDRLRPPGDVALIQGEGLEQILNHLAELIVTAALNPRALDLQRLIISESKRFPELAVAVAGASGRRDAIELISRLLVQERPAAADSTADISFLAQQFLQMVVSQPQMRAIGFGEPMSATELRAWTRSSVTLFLHGFVAMTRKGASDSSDPLPSG